MCDSMDDVAERSKTYVPLYFNTPRPYSSVARPWSAPLGLARKKKEKGSE